MWSHSGVWSPVSHTKVTLSWYLLSSERYLRAWTKHTYLLRFLLRKYCKTIVQSMWWNLLCVQQLAKNNEGLENLKCFWVALSKHLLWMENGVQEHDKVSADGPESKQKCKLIICQRQDTRHATRNQPNVRTGFTLLLTGSTSSSLQTHGLSRTTPVFSLPF